VIVVFVLVGIMTSSWYVFRGVVVGSDADRFTPTTGVAGGIVDEAIGSIVGDSDGAGVTAREVSGNRLFWSTQPEQKMMAITVAQTTRAIAELRMGI